MSAPNEHLPVTVVIPCFRCRDTIFRAVESVARQSARPLEVILVDDHSADATLQTLELIANQYPKDWIKVIALEQNGGPGSARNAGWVAAQGEYVAFLDADDAWHPKKLELQYSWMHAHPEVALTGHGTMRLKADEILDAPIGLLSGHPITARKLLLSNRFPARSVMVRKDIPFRFSPGKRHSEDYLLWLQIVLNGLPAQYLNAVLAFSYKADFGGAGLSAHLWKHEKGELATYRQLLRENLISMPIYCAVFAISVLKFARRVLLCALPARSA